MSHSQLKMTSSKQRKGSYYEHLASCFLQDNGLTLLYKNWLKAKVGEIDLILLETGKTWDVLVFVEVRVRNSSDYGDALMSVNKSKQKKLIKTAKYFLQQHPHYMQCESRFDVVAFTFTDETATYFEDKKQESNQHNPQRPDWIQGAFITDAW